ncbi:MAG: protein kinase [Pseudomonadota bacterium]
MNNIRHQARLVDTENTSGKPDFRIGGTVFRIGRHPSSDLILTQGTVSGRHAIIELRQNQYVVIDQKSTNKTRLNGEILEPERPYTLKNGDEIRLDVFPFIFVLEAMPPPPPPPPETEDDDETVFFDSQAMLNATVETGPAPPSPDDDETAFFDSQAMIDAAVEAGSPPTPPDDDETAFFDSQAMLDAAAQSASPPPEPDDDETVFLDDSEPAFNVEATFVRKEPGSKPGETKIGSYVVRNLLGKGGFGSVWEGLTPDGHPVAIKVLNPDVIGNERAVRKFFHEAIILSKMDHPNICRFIDFFPYEGNYAIVMDFVKGSELKNILEAQKGPLPLDTACRIAAQALDAFHYAHMKDILHRDIKPENISVDDAGTVKIMDFGIAKLSTSESQQTSLFMISPRYTAPERFDAHNTEAVDHRSDIYSLGLVFYEMFVGAHPFQTDSPTEMIVAHVNTVPAPPHEIVNLPRTISDAIMRAVEKNPQDRFEDFGAFKMALLNDPPRLSGEAALELSGKYCHIGARLFKGLAGAVKKYQKTATSFKIVQEGKEITLIIKTTGGNAIRITKSLDSL